MYFMPDVSYTDQKQSFISINKYAASISIVKLRRVRRKGFVENVSVGHSSSGFTLQHGM